MGIAAFLPQQIKQNITFGLVGFADPRGIFDPLQITLQCPDPYQPIITNQAPSYCLVNAMHMSASAFINDDESGLHYDYDVWLEKLAPHEPVSQYRHNVGEDNADAHMKRQNMGREIVVAVTDGKLDFGTWEQIFYGEFDGRRRKRALVKIIGE